MFVDSQKWLDYVDGQYKEYTTAAMPTKADGTNHLRVGSLIKDTTLSKHYAVTKVAADGTITKVQLD